MTRHRAAVFDLVAILVTGAALVPMAAQAPTGEKPPSETKALVLPKTPDGQPDIQGTWLFFDSTPFETPGSPSRQRAGETASTAGTNNAAAATAFQNFGGDRKAVVPRRQSMVVDPPDGKVPIIPSAVQETNSLTDHFYDSYKYQTGYERCITRGVTGGGFPTGYNDAYRILEGPGYVAIVSEMIHLARVIPTDGSSHPPQNMRFWDGDSRGHWEGSTLVVDVTNYNDRGGLFQGPQTGYLRGIRQSEALHVVERFTPLGPGTMTYEVTFEDRNRFTRPWKVSVPLSRDDSYKQFEFACHEGNYTYMTTTLRAGRVKDNTIVPTVDPTRLAAEEAAKANKR